MNTQEMLEWLDFHRCRSEKFRKWLRTLKGAEVKERKDEWLVLLKPISIDQARRASMRMESTLEIDEVHPENHVARVAELARVMRDPVAERQKEAKRREKTQAEAEARKTLEGEFGAELDGMSREEVLRLIDSISSLKVRVSVRRLFEMPGFPKGQRNKMIRPDLLKAMQARTVPAKSATAEEFQGMRNDIFGALGETPEDFKTNDQWSP